MKNLILEKDFETLAEFLVEYVRLSKRNLKMIIFLLKL